MTLSAFECLLDTGHASVWRWSAIRAGVLRYTESTSLTIEPEKSLVSVSW